MIDRVEILLIKTRYSAREWDFGSCLSTKAQVKCEKGIFSGLQLNASGQMEMTPAIYQSCQDTSPTRIVYQYSMSSQGC